MRIEKAQGLVNSILDTHITLVEGANREALRNVRQDLLLLVKDIVEQCKAGIDVDQALTDAENMTRRGPDGT